MKFDDTSPIVVAGGDGRVLAENRPARRMLGPGTGKYCWDFVGQLKDDEEKIPCRDGCVMELLEEGMDCSQQTQFTINGKHNHLSCVPANGIVICMLRSDEGKTPAMMHSLTPRELEILRLLAKGETTATAACQLGLNESTVRTHVERMRNKFSANTRAAIVAEGFRRGYLE